MHLRTLKQRTWPRGFPNVWLSTWLVFLEMLLACRIRINLAGLPYLDCGKEIFAFISYYLNSSLRVLPLKVNKHTRDHMRKISPDNHVCNVCVSLPWSRGSLNNCRGVLFKHTSSSWECNAQLTWKSMSYTTSQVLVLVYWQKWISPFSHFQSSQTYLTILWPCLVQQHTGMLGNISCLVL